VAGEKVAEAAVAGVVAVATDAAAQLSSAQLSSAHAVLQQPIVQTTPDKARTRPIRGANDTDVTPHLSSRNG
jgi:hypothetical protein